MVTVSGTVIFLGALDKIFNISRLSSQFGVNSGWGVEKMLEQNVPAKETFAS
jgi:hypothetical protein